MHIVFRARSSLKGIQTIQMGFFETWVLHLGLFFHFNLKHPNLYLPLPTRILGHCKQSLQYLHPYLLLPTGILGHNFNTCTYTYFYQTLTKKSLSDICPKPKKLYKLYKSYNAKYFFLKEHRKKIKNQNSKVLNYKYLLTERKYVNL